MGVSAKVVCDSSFGNTRLITLEVEFHRFVLAEVNTHRSLSRNYQSSRAVPVKQMIEQVRNNPAMPVRFGKNKSGMQDDGQHREPVVFSEIFDGVGEITNFKTTPEFAWKISADNAARMAEAFHKAGYAKQVVNRILEPFMWTKGVITGTYDAWRAFLKLRAHPDAQPEIQALAFKISDAIESSVPTELKEGEWHLPYVQTKTDFSGNKFYTTSSDELVEDEDTLTLEEAIKISTSCTAQTSYRKLDDSLEKAMKIYDMLNLPENGVYPEDPPHFSPTEHIAMAKDMSHNTVASLELSGNFKSSDFIQYRKVLELGVEKEIIQ